VEQGNITMGAEGVSYTLGPGEDDGEYICGLCGLPGADKLPQPIYWPDERVPDTPYVHADCEREECERASNLCQGEQRRNFLEMLMR